MDTTNQLSLATRTESNNTITRQKLLTTPESEAIFCGKSEWYYLQSFTGYWCWELVHIIDFSTRIEETTDTDKLQTDRNDVEITNTKDDFAINMELSKDDRAELISMPNPYYEDITQTYTQLKGVQMEDSDNKEFLPVHVILGASEYAIVKTKKDNKVGQKGEPVTEYTAFG